MTQKEALNILETGENVFLTGAAGSGKTFVLNKFITYLKSKKIHVGITASTGIAATHIDGLTIHSWAGVGIKNKLSKSEMKAIMRNKRIVEWVSGAEVLIIDEISMVSDYLFDMVNDVCQSIRRSVAPFGGLQIVVCGDFFQLPPVSRDGVKKYCFNSLSWKKANFKICYLEKQHRQEDEVYLKVLNEIRNNSVSPESRIVLSKRFEAEIGLFDRPTRLYSHNVNVDKINNLELDNISGQSIDYHMTSEGVTRLIDVLKRGCLAPEVLSVKKGALVMFVRNKFLPNGRALYVNGTMGRVVGFNELNFPVVETVKGKIDADPADWSIGDGYYPLAKIRQVPLKLAWAITIHKSQGMSLDCAEVDLGSCFEVGMGYVALSRIRSLNGLRLLGMNEKALMVDEDVLEFDRENRK